LEEEMTEKESQNSAANVANVVKGLYSPSLFANRVVLVTGGSRGIGRSIAVGFGALGAKVAVNYSGNEQAARETCGLIEAAGGVAVAVQFNVADALAVADGVKYIEKELGAIDILVNNAGISKDNLAVRMKDEEWNATLDTNLKGTFLCCRSVIMGMMRKKAGKIINISSVIGISGNAGQVAYAASKAGVFGLTKSLARELAGRNIQVNAIAPGYVSTDMTAALGEKLVNDVLAKIPAARIGEPVEIAKAAIFLASPAADYVTGQTLAVDGGMTM
jgi:3-oxoacyl-[acyl-carrier protein] reductase